jgi:sigma-B regulation protein RsbU (phosphoserine phosphatase)
MVTNPMVVLRRENARLQTENDQIKEELHNLRDFVRILTHLEAMTRKIQKDTELKPLLEDLFQQALSLLNTPDGSLLILDEEKHELAFVVVRGALRDTLTGYRISADDGIAGWVVKHAQPALVRDVRRDTRFSHMVDEQFTFRTQSIAAAPLIGDQRVLGVVEVLNQPGDEPFSENDIGLLSLLCRFWGEALADFERRTPEKA